MFRVIFMQFIFVRRFCDVRSLILISIFLNADPPLRIGPLKSKPLRDAADRQDVHELEKLWTEPDVSMLLDLVLASKHILTEKCESQLDVWESIAATLNDVSNILFTFYC